jgi:ankyrin repeat protein
MVIEAAYQPAPGIVTTLLTGRNPTNGELLFEVDRDERGRCRQCLHQDSLGMTPLHVAAMSHSTAALDIVCRLLEANSLAAGVHDLDGFLPLDLALRNPSRGSSSIVKVLLRAYPRAALVEASDSLDEDWVLAFDKLQPVVNDQMGEGFKPEKGRHEVSFEHIQHARDLRFEKYVWPQKHSKSMTNLKFKLDPGLAHFKSMTDLRSKLDTGHETCQDECAVKHKLSQSLMDLLLSDIPDGHAETREIGVASSKVDYYPVHKDFSYLTPQKLGVQQLLLEFSACYRPGNISVAGQTQMESFLLQDKLAADKVKRSRTSLVHRDHSANEIMRDIQTAIQDKQFRLHESLNTAWLSLAEMLLASEELDTRKKPCLLKNIIAKFLGKLELRYDSQICAQKLQEVLSENGICCQYSMAANLVLGADVEKKGYLNLSEFEDASLKACRFLCMGRRLVDRWEKDRNYVDCSGLDVEGTFTNLETEQDVNRDVFAKVVENCRLDNLDTRRRPPGRKRYTWSGMPLLEKTDTSMERRPKTIKAQQLLEKMTKPSSDARFRRRPLHYCCSNSLHPEAAVMLRDVLAVCERAAQVKDENGRLPLHLACMNESYTSFTMVRLLIEKYPEAAKIKVEEAN